MRFPHGSGGSLEPGSGMLFTLQFEIASKVLDGSTLGVAISGATMRDHDGKALAVKILTLDKPEAGENHTEGDLNGDGVLTNADKTLLIELLNPNSRPATEEELMTGDLNGDGKLNENDVVLLLQLLNTPEAK